MYDANQTDMVTEKAVMSENYVPERLIGREGHIREIMRCLAPALKKRRPLHLWVHGAPGSGKTVTTRHVLKHLNETAALGSVLVNCWEKDSLFSIVDDIVFRLGILRAEQHRTSAKLHKLGKYLNQRPFVIVLDEIDKLRPSERSAALYNLESLDNVGLICIACTQRPLFELEDRVRSRLNPYCVHFPSYSRQELTDILAHRARLALAVGVWSDSLLAEVADMAAGDARIAIRALKNMAELAEGQDRNQLSGDFLRRQWEAARAASQDAALRQLTEDHRIVHEIVKEHGQILSGSLWQQYVHRCAERRRTPLAPRTFSEYANRLIQVGLITSERARAKGKVRLFKVSPAVVPQRASAARTHGRTE
jgi:cell division control protein 6